MSKLYKKYVSLKVEDSSKIYLFKCGIFYVFLDEDAKLMANRLNLKLTNLNSVIVKCGFPVKSADKYFNIFKTLKYHFEIVTLDSNCSHEDINTFIMKQKCLNIINNFLSLNVDKLSIGQAFETLKQLQNNFKKLMVEYDK